MIGTYDTYYGRKEVSNSDLNELKKYFLPSSLVLDLQQAYRFGNLVDALITEPERCNHLLLKVDDEQFFSHEWENAMEMVKAFRKDSFCQQMMKMCGGQNVFTNPALQIQHDGIDFTLPARCKYDLFSDTIGYGGDIKSTVATSQRQFEDAFYHFNYDQSRSWYMDISGAKNDFVIGISKKAPYKIFKIFIDRNSHIYKSGKEKYQELAFKWWYMFSEMEVAA